MFAGIGFLFCLILFVVLLIWILVLQEKVDTLTRSIKLLNQSIDRLKISTVKDKTEDDNKVLQPEEKHEVLHSYKEPAQIKETVIPDTKLEQPKTHTAEVKSGFDFEKAFLGNIFNKIGALAIIIAVVIFIKLISPLIVITPVMKLLFGYLAGFGMISGALYIHHTKETMKNYSEVLLGTGFATLFITSFCGYSLLHIFNTTTAVSIGVVLLLATYLIADRMKTVSMLVIGLIGGYLTPLFTGGDNNAAFSYLIFLNIVSLVFTLKNKHTNIINLINLMLTMSIMAVAHLFSPINAIFPLVLWGVYIIYDLLRNKDCPVDSVLGWINYVVLTFFTILIFKDVHNQLGYLFATTAFVYLVLALASRFVIKSNQYKTYEYFTLMNIWLYIVFILNDVQSVITWSCLGLILALITRIFKLEYLTKVVIAYLATAFVAAMLAHNDGVHVLMQQYKPIFNLRTLIFAIPAASMYISGLLIKEKNIKTYNLLNFGTLSLIYIYAVGEINSLIETYNKTSNLVEFNKIMVYTILGFIYTIQSKRFYISNKYIPFNIASYIIGSIALIMLIFGSYSYPGGYMPVVNLRFTAYAFAIIVCTIFARWTKYDFYKYLAVFLGFFLIHSESVGIHKLNDNMQYIISVAWAIYSGLVTIFGILSNRRFLINSGITLIILTILRIFIFDLAKVDALYKLIAFLVLGIILMIVSYIYTAKKNNNQK